jgi:hypothetical protein
LILRLANWRFGDMDIIFKERDSLFFSCLETLRRLDCRIAVKKSIVCQTVNKYFPLGHLQTLTPNTDCLPSPLRGRHTEKEGLALDTVYSIQSASI